MKILFIGFGYHEYTNAINTEFEMLGFQSYFHDIQPGKLHFKIARRLHGRYYQSFLDRYHKSIIDSYDVGTIDHVVFLQVHQMSFANLVHLRSRQRSATFTLYNWDAVTTHDYRPYLEFFDRAFTFDPRDAEELGIGYLPLFATRRYQSADIRRHDPMSVYFIGNIVNPERYRVVRAFERFCKENGIRFELFMSTTLHGWTSMRQAGIRPQNVSLRQLPTSRQDKMISNSAAVFDFANHAQVGFTMRVMENLCAGKKIITNNINVRQAPFYREDRFLVYDGLDFSKVPAFLGLPLNDPEADFSLYHVQNFAAHLIGAPI
ncbi:MAG: hypothetical protein B7Y02_00160 [Rhodobacterales bacterium 17-64-5]|nr:MAG: hypothetical protein B7Y02_00160 [Rhodobacterales bacterium 17-64-5]